MITSFRFHHALALPTPTVALLTLTLLDVAYAAPAAKPTPEAKDTFFTKDATVHSAVSGEAYIGFANPSDFGSRKHPTSPTLRFVAGSRVENMVSVFNKSHVTINGGKIAVKATAYDSSVLALHSGDVGGGVYAEASSTVNVSGGNIGDGLYANGNSRVNLSGGNVNNGLFVAAHSTVTWSGGSVHALIAVSDSGTLKVIGTGLSKSLLKSPSPGEVSFSTYTLAGKLRDGTRVAGVRVTVQNKTGAKLLLINAH